MTWAESDLHNKMLSDEEYEKKCPICDMCKDSMVSVDHYYDIDDHIICPDCITDFIEYYRHSVESYIEGRR